ncbi:MAG: AraC family transcriptional regulator [Flavitalea sp.]
MSGKQVHRIKSITEYHALMGLPKPEHPSVSVINYGSVKLPCLTEMSLLFDYYAVLLDHEFKGKMKYGQQTGDFNEGVLFCMSPGQLFEIVAEDGSPVERSGWLLLIHPDFLWNTMLAEVIRRYEFFGYNVNEALFLSDKEERSVIQILETIESEYRSNIDKFSEPVIIVQLELLFTYADRYYHRQFLTRKISNHAILHRLEALLTETFRPEVIAVHGIPTVENVAASLNVSAGYLSGLLRVLTGKSTQHYIQDKLVDLAKEKLSGTNLSVSEIAYELGFEHPQSFSRLFKTKTSLSPLEFRNQF